ncbi:hypothetical protein ACOME3_003208 [Neoechinorhynchus agilis]
MSSTSRESSMSHSTSNNSTFFDLIRLPMLIVDEICPEYAASGSCAEDCSLKHGLVCPICCFYVLNYDDSNQRTSHFRECYKNLQNTFNLRRDFSKDAQCCVCLESVTHSEQYVFAVMDCCGHCLCGQCARSWFEKENKCTCPICRRIPDSIFDSTLWPSNEHERMSLIKALHDTVVASQKVENKIDDEALEVIKASDGKKEIC